IPRVGFQRAAKPFGCVSFAAFLLATQRKADKYQLRATLSAHQPIGAVRAFRTYLTDAVR
ncbi:MAG: hypothetical protein MSB05_03370, partial [Firmicutes bacterium]|nr:hypothetical protein [Bacillota bacterium]